MKCSRKRTLVIKLWKAYWAALLLISGVLQFVGCAVGPKYKTPPVPSPPAYKEIGNWKTAQPDDQHLGGNWWEIFQDPQLNALAAISHDRYSKKPLLLA